MTFLSNRLLPIRRYLSDLQYRNNTTLLVESVTISHLLCLIGQFLAVNGHLVVGLLFWKQRKCLEEDYVISIGGVTFGENRHARHHFGSRLYGKTLDRGNALTR